MPHRLDYRNAARGDRAHHDFFVERPQILDRAAAAPNDEEIGARHRPPRLQRLESPDRAADLRGRPRPLHLDRPPPAMRRATIPAPVEDVADPGDGGRGDDADNPARSDETRVGQEGYCPRRTPWCPDHNN